MRGLGDGSLGWIFRSGDHVFRCRPDSRHSVVEPDYWSPSDCTTRETTKSNSVRLGSHDAPRGYCIAWHTTVPASPPPDSRQWGGAPPPRPEPPARRGTRAPHTGILDTKSNASTKLPGTGCLLGHRLAAEREPPRGSLANGRRGRHAPVRPRVAAVAQDRSWSGNEGKLLI